MIETITIDSLIKSLLVLKIKVSNILNCTKNPKWLSLSLWLIFFMPYFFYERIKIRRCKVLTMFYFDVLNKRSISTIALTAFFNWTFISSTYFISSSSDSLFFLLSFRFLDLNL